MITLDVADVLTCCASPSYAKIVASGQHSSMEALIDHARSAWWQQVPVTCWLEAFAAHPRIGDMKSLQQKFGAFTDHSRSEQASAAAASSDVLQELLRMNQVYEAKFGHIFIICASGKSADEMLTALRLRHGNEPHAELQLAAAEQMAITELRLRKLLEARREGPEAGPPSSAGGPLASVARRAAGEAQQPQQQRSPITTHVLDTSVGRPAAGVAVALARRCPGSGQAWADVAAGVTNRDGRVGDLLPPSGSVEPGLYRITFEMEAYMERCREQHPGFFAQTPFYPRACVFFQVAPSQTREHFHVPLTWNPYGYSTYRGS